MTLNDLQDVVFVDADKETVQAELIGLYTSITGRTLAQGDPVRLFLLTIAEIIIQQREFINYTGKQNLLKYAVGNNLDHLGILVGVGRLPASPAVTTVRFTLSEKRAVSTVIPAGTRVTAGDNVFFAIGADAAIPAGKLQMEVPASCTQTGTIGNGYLPGELSTLVDPVPFVASARNTTTSEGGSEIENDESFREAIREAPEKFPTTGPSGAYEYYAKRASSLISDVLVWSPEAGRVEIRPLLEGGRVPGEEILNLVKAACNDKTVRPLTDQVSVQAPTVKNYDIQVTYYIGADSESFSATIQQAVTEAVNQYVEWQKEKLGRDINPSQLMKNIIEAGAKRAEITEPVFTKVENTAVAVADQISVTMGGIESE